MQGQTAKRLDVPTLQQRQAAMDPIRLLAVGAAWFASAILAVALPFAFVQFAERSCPPPQIDASECAPMVRTALIWFSFFAGVSIGAAAAVLFPALCAPQRHRPSAAKACLGAGVVCATLLAAVLALAIPAAPAALPAIVNAAVALCCLKLVEEDAAKLLEPSMEQTARARAASAAPF